MRVTIGKSFVAYEREELVITFVIQVLGFENEDILRQDEKELRSKKSTYGTLSRL